ncbi:phage capsid protein [Lactiplantibacillus plantarum]|uniref:phage capsid protein n=1 Tax=Lactiplantibacillus plantarum TaxID=1590 RepID=UPI0030A9BC5E
MVENQTKAQDIAIVQSIDFVNRFKEQITGLTTLLGVSRKLPMSQDGVLRTYKWVKTQLADQVGEGEEIPLTKVERKINEMKVQPIRKYRKQVTAEAIIHAGSQDLAINQTDQQMVREIQKDVKANFISFLQSAPTKQKAKNLQDGLAQAWAKVSNAFQDYGDVEIIHFISPFDVADYLGSGQIVNTSQSVFGMTALENFLGQKAIVFDMIPKGKIYSTATENIVMAYYGMSGTPIASSFGLTTDDTGLIGMTHQQRTDNATVETLSLTSLTLFAEVSNGVVETALNAPTSTTSKPVPTSNTSSTTSNTSDNATK